jgi:hypothetical protein
VASWAEGFTPPKSRTGPNSVPAVFRDEAFATIFGKTLDGWDQRDFRTLDEHMKSCQQELFKKHRQKAKQINKVRRYVPAVQREVQKASKGASPTKKVSPQQAQLEATVDRLEKYRPSQRLADQIALTRDVMQGKPADLQTHGLRRMPNWISQVERARASLSEAEMAPYIQRLAEREAELRAQFKKDAEAFTALQQELEAVPLNQAGLVKLRQLERSPVLGKATPQQVAGFRAEVQRKHVQIQAEMRRLKQAERSKQVTQVQRPTGRTDSRQAIAPKRSVAPSTPEYLVEVISGDGVEDALLLGLKPGVDHRQAIDRVKKERGLKQTLTLSMTQGYGRGGRMVEFTAVEDAVGQIDFTDYFKAAIDPGGVQHALAERYGDPDEVQQVGGGRLMTWDDDGQLLQVLATNQVHNAVKYKGYRSRLSLALWSKDYAQHLAEVNERCSEIWDKPRNELSMNDKQYAGQNCPLMPGTKKKAGVQSLL